MKFCRVSNNCTGETTYITGQLEDTRLPKETLKQRDKRELDLQLDEELEGTFPASDPLKITRYSSEISAPTRPSRAPRDLAERADPFT
jgi:hypothetical protein